jgi:hypothetical protein
MASKNLGAVIQRAISDGAFRRQLQSDPAAALRGFNLTADEIAAIRSGDSSKLMSLGVDQRMSKAFSVGTLSTGGAARSTVSDLNPGGTASTIANDPTAGTREALTTGNLSGTRAVHDSEPFDNRGGLADPTVSGTRAIHDSQPFDSRGVISTGNIGGTRAVNDSAPFDSRGGVADPTVSGTRAVNDSEPFALNIVINDNQAAMNAGRGGSLAGDMSVSSQMADAGTADAVRAIHDVAPFDSGINTVASTEVIPTDELRAMEHPAGGDAVVEGTTGPDTGNEHSWG